MKTTPNSASLIKSQSFRLKRSIAKIGKFLPIHWRLAVQRRTYRRRIAKNWSTAYDGFKPLPPAERVGFMVAGSQKAGTSALIKLLGQHPQIALPVVKEPHFFDNDGFFSDKSIPVKEYHAGFPYLGPDRLYGEGTPRTMFSTESVERVFEYNPKMKIICVLRDPVERAYSAWNMNKTAGETRSFEELTRSEMNQIEKYGPIRRGFNSYLSRGMYANQIVHLRKYFSPNQLMFIKYSRFKENNATVLDECIAFLELDPLSMVLNAKNTNVYRYESTMLPSTEKRLRDWYAPEISKVESLLCWNLSDWKNMKQ